jgi:pimeloyl-ACP methyl ester carboxylesterase
MTDSSGTPEEQGMRYISVLFPAAWLRSNGQRVREVFYRPMGHIDGESVGRQSMAIGEWKGTTARLGSIAVPTLVIAGADDQLAPPDNSHSMAGKIPGSRLVLVADGGHGLMFQFPGIFLDEVSGFLK